MSADRRIPSATGWTLLYSGYPAHRPYRPDCAACAPRSGQKMHPTGALAHSVENILAHTLDARPPSNAFKRLSVEGLDALGLDGDVALAAKANVAIIAALNTQIDQLEQRLVEGQSRGPNTPCSKASQVLARYWPLSSCSRQAISPALRRSATSPLTPVALTAPAIPTARKRTKATPRTATLTWCGP